MRSAETEGDTIDDAIESALRLLQVARDRVEVEILASPARGMFGFGAKKARVRATVRAPLFASFDDVLRPDTVPAEVPRETPAVRDPVAAPAQAAPGRAEARARPARRTPASEQDRTAPRATSVSRPTALPERAAPAVPPSPAAVSHATELLTRILELIGVPSRIEAHPGDDPGTVVLDVAGEASGLLIGHRGQMLDALEYLVNRLSTRDENASGRFVVDVARYRERRREYLEELARRLAEKVKQTGKMVTLNPMNPRDRRTVHLTLQTDGAVTTRSHGEGHLRKVLILPADRGRGAAPPARSPA
jgi:spoIIIJ-associated protein